VTVVAHAGWNHPPHPGGIVVEVEEKVVDMVVAMVDVVGTVVKVVVVEVIFDDANITVAICVQRLLAVDVL